jgi:uncharacterized protein (TIGR03086 family)
MDIIELLDRSYAWTTARVRAVRGHDLDRPTPCSRWDLRHLLNHTLGAQDLVVDAVAGRPVDSGYADPGALGQALAEADRIGTDPVAAYDALVKRAMAVWRTPDILDGTCQMPFGPTPVPVAARIALIDIVVHGWDISRATGEAADIPPELAEPVLAFARDMVAGPMRGTAFADEVAIDGSTGAPVTASDRLVAFLGRKPAWA